MQLPTSSRLKPAWVEGTVNRAGDHVSLCYGENRKAVALVAHHDRRGFTVQFLLKSGGANPRTDRILDEVNRELLFYLLQAVGPDSWPFVQYHCDTPANRQSMVHWDWHPKPRPLRAIPQ